MPANLSIPVKAIRTAAGRRDVVEQMTAFYERADQLIAGQPATCWNKGECCRFGQFGHRLYVTSLEVAYYLNCESHIDGDDSLPWPRGLKPAALQGGMTVNHDMADRNRTPLPILPSVTEDACPHAYDGMCHVRGHRPLGCRIFYCDPAAQHWQGPLTEELLAELRDMHVELHVPYVYADWMTVLRALDAH